MAGTLREEMARRPMVCDGAMGTQLIARGLGPGECAERWNLEQAPRVASVHEAYLAAGCDMVTTNTFGGTTATLERHGLAERAGEVNRCGAALARRAADAAGGLRFVLGDIGPFGGFLEPVGEMRPDELLAMFQRQAEALAAGGVDGFIVETMVDPAELSLAVRAARGVGKPVMATYAFNAVEDGFRTIMGTTAEEAMRAAIEAGADAAGTNCGTSLSLEQYAQLAERLLGAAGNTPVIVQPNAGSPVMLDGQLQYRATPEDMAALAQRLLGLGVRVIGGCCGTTPAHLGAMARTVRAWR